MQKSCVFFSFFILILPVLIIHLGRLHCTRLVSLIHTNTKKERRRNILELQQQQQQQLEILFRFMYLFKLKAMHTHIQFR
jgi:hypothetical protein